MSQEHTVYVEAILIMDTRSVTTGLRSQNLGGSWSRLYKAEGLYLDLSLKLERNTAVLMGQVLEAESAGSVLQGSARLKTPHDNLAAQVSLDESGSFRLELPKNSTHHLEVALPSLTLRVSDLST